MKLFKDAYEWKDILFDLYVSENMLAMTGSSIDCVSPYLGAARSFDAIFDERRCPQKVSEIELEKILYENGKNRGLILDAHGGMRDGRWCYFDDDDKPRTVQSWIDENDNCGYGALIICCCNENNVQPAVRTTPIFYAEGIVDDLGEQYRTKLVMPKG